MTRKTNLKFTTLRYVLAVILAVLMCLSLFFASACKNEDSSTNIPEFSYTDNSNSTIKNPTFVIGTSAMDYDDFPKTTVDGWALSKDSSAKSGVVDVSEKGWADLMSNLVKDTGILNYVRYVNNNFTDADIKDKIREEAGDNSLSPTSAEIKEYIVNNYLIVPEQPVSGIVYPFVNPSKHASDIDNKVYMLNNYTTSDLGFGGVQTLSSSTKITLERGQYAKVSAWIKTANLNISNSDSGYNDVDGPIGACLKVKNVFSSSSQSDFGIYNITNTDWQEYHFYIKADDVYETSFTVSLGLGYDDYAAEGTVYFDDLNVELLDKDEYESLVANETATEKTYKIEYNNKKNQNTKAFAKDYSANYHLYDMSINLLEQNTLTQSVSFHSDKTDEKYYKFTQYEDNNSNGNLTGQLNASDIVSKINNFSDIPYGITEGIKVELTKPASYTISLFNNSGSEFEIGNENYTTVIFFVKNQLSKLYSTNICVNVQDIYEGNTVERPNVVTLSEVSDEWVMCSILLRNNFSKDKNSIYKTRKFYLDIVIGPDSYQDDIDNYALGTVSISNPIIATGATYQYIDEDSKIETPNYNFFNLFSNNSTGAVALYSGYSQDYSADSSNSDTYNITVSPSDIGTIIDRPANPNELKGIEAKHYYVTGEIEDSLEINNNRSSGLINTKYIDNYDSNIKSALNYKNTETHIQPLMIKTEGKSYGFISSSYTVEQSSYAKVSVDVRVPSQNSTAYVYLVDTSKGQKNILTFNQFTVNTTAGEQNNYNKEIAKKELYFEITTDDMQGKDWITIEFYIATGANAMNFRLELWNGSRSNTSTLNTDGYVFFNNITLSTSDGFLEPTRWEDAFTGTESPLSGKSGDFDELNLLAYKRPLTAREIEYNNDKDKKGSNISYNPKYIYAQSNTMIYAIYNTLDPVIIDPYEYENTDDETEEETTVETDSSAFWLSLSTILLGVALLLAIIMLFIKNIRYRRKANASDAKTHYVVKSRTHNQNQKVSKTKNDGSINQSDVDTSDSQDSFDNETISDTEPESTKEQTLDEYVYGDVQDFGNEQTSEDEKN